MGAPAKNSRLVGPGDRLAGKYELIRQLAVGGMAELYLARTLGIEGFEKLSVIKRILPQFMDDAHFVSMFLNEARLAAALHHPSPQVFDIGVEQGDYFFSMEYVHGENLGQLAAVALDSGVPLSLDAALTLIVGLCAGLHYAHEKLGTDGKPLRVVHRDVSPSNVLVTAAARSSSSTSASARASRPRRVAFKEQVAYVAQAVPVEPLDRRSDLFSIGTMLYRITTGQQPFADHSRFGPREDRRDRPGDAVVDRPGIGALERIVLRAMARDPDQRYTSALELQGHLEDSCGAITAGRRAARSTLFPARLEEWQRALSPAALRRAGGQADVDRRRQHPPASYRCRRSGRHLARTGRGRRRTCAAPTPLPFARVAAAGWLRSRACHNSDSGADEVDTSATASATQMRSMQGGSAATAQLDVVRTRDRGHVPAAVPGDEDGDEDDGRGSAAIGGLARNQVVRVMRRALVVNKR